jgi:hypothetical protein
VIEHVPGGHYIETISINRQPLSIRNQGSDPDGAAQTCHCGGRQVDANQATPSFILATAPAGAPLAEVTVRISAGVYGGPSRLRLSEVVTGSMDDEVFWRTGFDPATQWTET